MKYTVHKSEPNSLGPQTCAATLYSLHPQTCRCDPTYSSLNKALVQLHQKLILEVGVGHGINVLIMMNRRKQLASVETLYNKVSLERQ